MKMEVWACLLFLFDIKITLIVALPQPGVVNDQEEFKYRNVGPFRARQENKSQPISNPLFKMVEGDIKIHRGLPFYAGVRNVWPDGIIPFVVKCSLHNNPKAIRALKEAMVAWETKTDYCVQFIPKRPNDRIYVKFDRSTGCSSGGVGFSGASYTVSIGHECEYKHVMEHELGHVIGFFHEQSRRDRDRYIDIRMENVARGQRHNFDIAWNTVNSGEKYDFDSIMHYPFDAFTKYYGVDTIVPKPPHNRRKHRPYHKISESDIRQTQTLYKCPVRVKRSSDAHEDCSKGVIHRSCKRWADAGHCVLNPGALLFSCPVSCNNCARCKDNALDCKQRYKNCTNYNMEPQKFYNFLMDCRLTCGTCEQEPTEEPTEAPTTEEPTTKQATTEKPTEAATPTPPKTTSKKLPAPPLTLSSLHPFPPLKKFKYRGVKCEDEARTCTILKERGYCKNDPEKRDWCMLTCKEYFDYNPCDIEEPKPDGWCNTPFGISAFHGGKPRGIRMRASSSHRLQGDRWSYPPQEARLYNKDNERAYTVGTWCAALSGKRGQEYLEIGFAKKRNLAAIATQGRPNFFEHVRTYKVRLYNKENNHWTWYKEDGEPKIFDGNCDNATPVLNKFKQPYHVDAIRIYPLDYVGGRCLRVELYGC